MVESELAMYFMLKLEASKSLKGEIRTVSGLVFTLSKAISLQGLRSL